MALRRLNDGTIISANVLVNKAPNDSSKYNNFGIYKAAILKAFPKDDPNNVSKKTVEYEAIIVSGSRQGEIIRGVHPLDTFGGKDNFNEIVYKPKEKVLKGKDAGSSTFPEDTDASYVVIGFMNGYYNNPIILGGWRQPNNSTFGASEADGTLVRGQFQNLSWSINNNGVLNVNHSGTSITLDNSGNVSIVTTSKATINSSGNTEITTSGKAKITSSQNVEVTSAQAVEVGGATGITFTGPFVKLGGSGASEHVILGDLFKTFFDGHVHSGGGGAPVTPMPTSTLSTKSTVE